MKCCRAAKINELHSWQAFTDEFYLTLMEEITLLHTLLKCRKQDTLIRSLDEASITLIPKPPEDISRELQSNINQEHRYKNSKQNISVLNPPIYRKDNKSWTGFILGLQGWFNNKKQTNVTNHVNNKNRKFIQSPHWMQKNIWQTQYLLMTKTLLTH